MISFENFIKQEDCDKYNMLLECNAIIENKNKEIERLNNIINCMEEDLKEMYITFGEFNEEYTEKKIKELKEGD